jgi:hypothetical protein
VTSSHDNGIPKGTHQEAAIRLGTRWSTRECLGEAVRRGEEAASR